MMKKKTMGRRKIEIKKIQRTDSRQVTFSKRRAGLFNKASELCILTGAEILILAQSMGGRVFTFAHPDADSVVDTFLGKRVANSSPVSEDTKCMVEEFNKNYLELEVEKNNFKSINNVEESDGFWWNKSFEVLEADELEVFVNSMEQLKINVTKRADELRDSVTTCSIDMMANANNVDVLLDDQVIWPSFDQLLPDNENMMMPAVNYDTSGFNSYSFIGITGELIHDNHEADNLQVQSDFGTFGHDQI